MMDGRVPVHPRVRGIRLLREETGLSLAFPVALVNSWLDGGN